MVSPFRIILLLCASVAWGGAQAWGDELGVAPATGGPASPMGSGFTPSAATSNTESHPDRPDSHRSAREKAKSADAPKPSRLDGDVIRGQAPRDAGPPGPGTQGSAGPPLRAGPTRPVAPSARAPSPPVAAAAPTPPSVPGAGEAFASAPATGLEAEGGGAGLATMGFRDIPIMLGDLAPFSFRQIVPPGTLPPAHDPGRPRSVLFAPWARGFKIADNQSPQPQDRFFYVFDYFDRLNDEINRRVGSGVHNIQAYRNFFGLEKTFLGGYTSLGIRMPLDTLSASSRIPGLGGTSTAVDRLTIFGKYALRVDRPTGSLVSGGLAVTPSNGPTSFAGSRSVGGFHDSQIQPFLGYIWRRGRFYIQGFSAIDIPTDINDVTEWYNDIGIGYYAYRSNDPARFLTAFVPTFEVHVNDPLNHRGAFRYRDPAGTPDVVDFTWGASFVLRQRGILSLCVCDAITGPRPFNLEAAILFNLYFGRTRAAQVSTPPPLGP